MPSLQQRTALVLERLDANRRVLRVLASSPEFRTTATSQQQTYLQALVHLPPLAATNAADLCERIADIGWPIDLQDAAVVATLSKSQTNSTDDTVDAVPTHHRTQLQNMTTIEHNLPARIWGASTDQFGELLCEFAVTRLGLRNPSEPTVQKITSLIMLVQDGQEQTLSRSFQAKRSMVDLVKASLKRYRPNAPTIEWINVLPQTASQFMREFPAVFDSAYQGTAPAPCPLPQTSIALVVSNCPCRSSLRRTGSFGMTGLMPPSGLAP